MNWNLESYFPTFDGPELGQFKDDLRRDIAALQQQAAALDPLSDATADRWQAVLLTSEELSARLSHIGSYIGCLTAADARNEAYAREEADLSLIEAEASKLSVEIKRAFKTVSDADFNTFLQRPALTQCSHYLGRLRQDARRTMSTAEETLAADLGVNGIKAWGRLYDTIAGKLEFDMHYPDGRQQRLPMAQRRSLLGHADRQIRRAAFDGGNAAWAQVEDTAAAALNAISGIRHSLNHRRQVDHFLDIALFQASITRNTLDAMFEAIRQNIALPRRILALKSRAMNTQGVAWYDLEAPLPLPDQETLSWEQGKALVGDAFTKAYPALGDFVHDIYQKEWIEWEPRPGKRPGAFCTGSLLSRESRIYMTYNDSINDVRTLAHEAGHAFHSFVMRDLRTYARRYPMTLAESASTFGEMILTQGILSDPDISVAQKARVLDLEAAHGAVYLMDIPVRFRFEKAFYEERANGEVSVSRLKELMTQAQRDVFGDALEAGGEDPYFWASKLHFYITGTTFYNFPYTFGFLLSRGLFALFQQDGEAFLPRYEEFLRLTGSDTAENLARRSLDCDLESPQFWAGAIQTLETPLLELEKLLPELLPQDGQV